MRIRPRRRRLGGRLLGVNLSGLRPTSITSRIPFVSIEWWRASSRRHSSSPTRRT